MWYEWVKHHEEVIVALALIGWFLLSVFERVDITDSRAKLRRITQ